MMERIKELLDVSERDGTTVITIPLAVAIALVVLALLLALVIWSLKRRRDPKLKTEDHHGTAELIPSLAGLTHGDLVEGNSVKILQNGDGFFPVLTKAIKGAKQSIHFETFLCKKGKLLDSLCRDLAAKAREGVTVRLLVDASGGKHLGKENVKLLEDAGVHLARFHPYRLSNIGFLNNRDHRKIVVIDGSVAFVGGHCLVDTWLGNGQDKKHFRDISIRVEGPAVSRIQSAFTENWIEETGEVPAGTDYFRKLEPCGESCVHVAYTTPANASSSVKLLHYLAIRAATERLTIQNPYFLPDPEAIEELLAAVKRGAEVRVMLPATSVSDMPIVQHASHHHFGTLLKGGVRIFEYNKTLLHQKILVVDGKWAAVGSTNFDDRSFETNDEISIGIVDEEIAAELEAIFEADLKHAEECSFEAWSKRPWRHKLLDGVFYAINEQL